MTTKISSDNIQASTLATIGSGPKISQIQVCDSSYNVLDDTAVDIDGGYIKIIGTGFKTGATVTINRQQATSVTFVSSTELRAQVAAEVAGTYVVYVVNTDGSVALRVNGITFSSEPTWVTSSTLPTGDSGTAISIQLAATEATAYSVASNSTLPSGLTLSSGGLLAGTININDETLYNFTVVATDAQLQDSPRSFSITITVGDPNWKAVTTLLSPKLGTLPFNADSSANNLAVTVFGDTKPSGFNPYTPGRYSVFFDAKTDYISVPAATNLKTFTGDFTFEAWIYPTDTDVSYWKIWDSRQSGATAQAMVVGLEPTSPAVTGQGRLNYYNGSTYYGTGIVYYNRWTHIAFVRSGTTMTFYVDGVAGGTATVSGTQTGSATTNPIYISTKDNGLASYGTTGYISDLRVVNGTAVYTGNFTPPTEPLTAITNTVLLTCQSNGFVDNSTSAHVLTPSSVSISGFDPYLPVSGTATYGSTYFDGSGDYLEVPYSSSWVPSGTAWSVEFWFYATTNSASIQSLLRIGSAAYAPIAMVLNSSSLYIDLSTSGSAWSWSTGAKAITLNAWHHVALVRNSETTTAYLNGVSYYSAASVTLWDSNASLGLGAYTSGVSPFSGYISNVRVVKGTAVYTADFTPPAQPLTATTNTSLLTCQTNQPVNNHTFVDYSNNNLLVTRAGNATQGTFSPYGENWSNYFDGNTDFLTFTNTIGQGVNFGTGSFTVELWYYMTDSTTNSTYHTFIRQDTATNAFDFGYRPGLSQLSLGAGNVGEVTASVTLTPRTWNHIAVSRSGTSLRFFVNGTQVGTTLTNSYDFGVTGGTVRIGSNSFNAAYTVYGYLSNLRCTKSALYTANFTPSTTPLQPASGTSLLTCRDSSFVDDSPNNFAITRNGDVSVQSFGPFAGTTLPAPAYSVFLDGNSDYISRAWSSEFDLGNTYTIEMWLYSATATGWKSIFNIEFPLVDYFGGMSINLRGTDNKLIYTMQQATGGGYQSSAVTLADTDTFVQNKWYHVAVSVNAGTGTLYIDGVSKATASIPLFIGNPAGLGIGGHYNGYNLATESWPGYISNLRIVKGTAVYTSNFTPPTSQLTAINGTLLLACQSPTVADNSTNNFVLISNGNTKPATFSPLTVTYSTKQSYTPAVFGGSMYFDGTGDYLTAPSTAFNISTSTSWSIECWFYSTLASTEQVLWQNYTTSGTTLNGQALVLQANNTIVFQVWQGSSAGAQFSLTSSAVISNTWNHVAVVRNASGTNNNLLFVNGVLAAQGTWTTHTGPGSTLTYIGARNYNGIQNPFNGYISNLRVVKGQAVYTSNFVPQNRPLTPVQNTALLLGNTSGAVFDSAGLNVFETLGDTKLSTAITKYGNSSISFDGNGDYIWAPASRNYDFGSGDWTIECWVYFNSVASAPHIWQFGSGSTVRAVLYMSTAKLRLFRAADRIVGTTTLVANQWYHLAVSFQASNTTTRLYINGVLEGSVNNFNDYPKNAANIRFMAGFQPYSGAAGDYLNGYISDMRVTKGLARYTANFTPPTTPLQAK